jgi:hypothetical protein
MPRLGTKSLVKSNIQYWMNDLLLSHGLYTNVATGETDYNGVDISSCNPVVNHPTYADGQVFQSAFKNWTYESGVTVFETGIAAPTVASGVTVDGTFYATATTTGAYAHQIDFPNGTVIFDSPLGGAPTVQATFSYKMVTVEMANNLGNENVELLIQTTLKDNPPQTGVVTYPEQNRQNTLPAVFIDFLSRDSLPYELGTKDPVKVFMGFFHVWTHGDMMQDILEDILADAQRDVLFGIDFNSAPHPLLSMGEPNPAWTTYADMARQASPHYWRKIYLDISDPKQDKSLYEIERSKIAFKIKVYPNF